MFPVSPTGCLGCGAITDHNLGCFNARGTPDTQAHEYVASIARAVQFALEKFVPVSGARSTRPIVDAVVAYLNDPLGLILDINRAHRAWQNPAVFANLSRQRHIHEDAIQSAAAQENGLKYVLK